MRRRAVIVALLSIAVMVAARYAWAIDQRFDAEDLRAFEATDYGVDLPDWYGEFPFLLVWTRGDGQAFVSLAADPLVQGPARELGITLYRFGRVGYSLAGRALVGWQHDLIPVGLVLVNTIGLGVLGWIAGLKTKEWGYRSLWLVLNPAVFISYTGDTAEILGLAAIASVAVWAARPATLVAGLILGSARPSFLTAAPLARRGLLLTATASLVAVGLLLTGLSALGLEWSGAGGNLALPFVGYAEAWSSQPPYVRAISVGVMLVATLALLASVPERGARRLAFAATAILVLCLDERVVEAPRNLLRGAGALPMLWALGPPGRDLLPEGANNFSEK